MNTDTPRTDAVESSFLMDLENLCPHCGDPPVRDAHWQAMRTLERELNAAQARIAELEAELLQAKQALVNAGYFTADRMNERDVAISFIKELNATTNQHGRHYRSRCGQFLAKLNQTKQ